MSRWTVEFDGGGHVEVDAPSEYQARRAALLGGFRYGREVVEVRPFAAKPKQQRPGKMPAITVRPDPWDKLRDRLETEGKRNGG